MNLRSKLSRSKRLLEEHGHRVFSSWSRNTLVSRDDSLHPVRVGSNLLVGRTIEGVSSADIAFRNLTLVTDLLDDLGAPYFLVPSASRVRHTIGVLFPDSKRLVNELCERHLREPVFIGRPAGANGLAHPMLTSDPLIPQPLRAAQVLRVGQIGTGPSGDILYGPELACDVELWEEGDQVLSGPKAKSKLAAIQPQATEEVLRDSLVAPRRNRIADVIPASEQKPAWVRISNREIPTFQPFTELTVDDINFPIDVVYTWVDGNDPVLRAKREAHRGEIAQILDKEINDSRYTSHDELKYSLRSVWMYAPFVRNIYIVTDDQTPSWLDTSSDRVKVVSHRDIFPEGALPVFNSHAIETRLHRIPGLSEHYLYFNDDVFVGRPITPQHFFYGNGIARVPVSPLKIGLGSAHPLETATNSAGKNVRELLKTTHGRFTTNNFMHTPLPQIRSALMELEELFPEEIGRTTHTRFRSPDDVAICAPMLFNYLLMTGRGVRQKYKFKYVNISRDDAPSRMREIRKNRKNDVFCLNDVDVPPEIREEIHERMIEFLNSMYPTPSPYEH